MSRPSRAAPPNDDTPQEPIPFAFTIPAKFTPGQQRGNVACINSHTARIALSPPLRLSHRMETHLLQASLPFSQPNVGAAADAIPGYPNGNNRMSITWPGTDGGHGVGARFDVRIPKGLYGISDLEDALNYFGFAEPVPTSPGPPFGLGATLNYTSRLFQIKGVSATQQIVFGVDPTQIVRGPGGPPYGQFPAVGTVSVDFLNPGADGLNDSLAPILGFLDTPGVAPLGGTLPMPNGGTVLKEYLAPLTANFVVYNAYAMYVSFCRDSYQQGVTGQLLYVFNIAGSTPNSLVEFGPSLASMVPVSSGSYSTIDVWFSDELGRLLSLANFDGNLNFNLIIAKMRADGTV